MYCLKMLCKVVWKIINYIDCINKIKIKKNFKILMFVKLMEEFYKRKSIYRKL